MATEAMKELFIAVNCKRRRFFGMKRAKPLDCIPRALKTDIIRNYTDNVGRITNSFGEVVHVKPAAGGPKKRNRLIYTRRSENIKS